jgi:chromate reductase
MTTLLGISGSLRKDSFNTALLRSAADHLPAGTTLEVATLEGVPLYDGDAEKANGVPAAAEALKQRVMKADGVLIATPEYNHGIPGVLKNAFDWMTRPPKDIPKVWRGRAVGVVGVTVGQGGTRWGQTAWLPVLHVVGARIFTAKQLYVSGAEQAFKDGKLEDAETVKHLTAFLAEFATFAGAAPRG